MDNTQHTLATLFGASSVMSPRVSSKMRVGFQEFAFAGMDGVFGTAMGHHGTDIVWTGYLKTASNSTSLAVAGDAMNALIETIAALYRDGTVIDLFYNDSTNMRSLYVGSLTTGAPTYTNLMIRDFGERGKRIQLRSAANSWVVAVEFDITFLKLA